MSNLFEDHIAAFAALLTGAGLTVYDGEVPDDPAVQYVLLYDYFVTPDGLTAPDALSLTFASGPLDPQIYVHSVGVTRQSARATAARVRAAVLDQVLVVTSRTCFPVRHRDGQPVRPDEDVPGRPVHGQVDVYGWRSLPA